MAVQITDIKRVFKFKDERLDDPDPTMSVAEAIEFYSRKYPELAAGTVKKEYMEGNTMVYDLQYTVGEKA